MAQSSSGAPDISSSSNISSAIPQPGSISSAQNQLLASSALTRTSSCAEYDRLVGKIMRDNFWSLDPFTVGLNPRLFDFHKEYIRSKAPHIKAKSYLLRRVLARMVEDEHLYLASAKPVMYITHPNRSTVDYLVMGDDPPWIPHFFNGSQAYPHIEEAMSRITTFLDSGTRFQPPTRLPTVGVSRASGYAISRMKTEELPSVEEYIDFVHFVVQSGSSPGSSGIIREDHFFPSVAVLPVAEVRKRANLITRLMARMVEDGVLTRVSAEDGTYTLHQDCQPSDYKADRGLTDNSHWVWTFQKWAVLDPVAEKAVQNLDTFLMDISPAEKARVKIELDEDLPPSKLEPMSRIKQNDDDVYIVKQEQAASPSTRSRAPKAARPKYKRSDRNVSSSSSSRSESSGSDQSSIIPILTRPKSPPPLEMSTSPEPDLDPENSLMPSIEDLDDNSPTLIQRREEKSYADYLDDLSDDQRYVFLSAVPVEFATLHAKYINDAFEVIIEKTSRGHNFKIVCHDCNDSVIAKKYEGSLSKLRMHLEARKHVTNLRSKLESMEGMSIEDIEAEQRFRVLKRRSEQQDLEDKTQIRQPTSVHQSTAQGPPAIDNTRASPSTQDVETLRTSWGLPQKAFHYKPPRKAVAMAKQNGISSHESPSPIVAGPSRLEPPLPLPSPANAALEELRRETADRFETLLSSNKRRKLNLDHKLEHYGEVLGQALKDQEELEKSVTGLGSRHDQHEAELRRLGESVTTGIGSLLTNGNQLQNIPDEVSEQLEALLAKDEEHETRWGKQEEARIKLSAVVDDLAQGQKALEGRIGSIESRHDPKSASNDSAIDARIKALESSKADILESQAELEQDNRVMNARFVLLEQHDESLEEAASLLTGIATRVENLEVVRDEGLVMDHSFQESQKSLTGRIEAVERQLSIASSSTSPVTTGSTNEMIALLKEQCAAQNEHIIRLGKASRKANKWIDYYEKVTTAHKAHIAQLDSKQADDAIARAAFEKRMEEREEKLADRIEELLKDSKEDLMKESKEREERMMARIKKLEQREEHTSGQLALLKTYAPRSTAGSETGRAGSSTPRSSSHTGAILPPSLTSSQMGTGTRTPKPSTQLGASVARANNGTPIRPPSVASSQTGAGSNTPRPSSQMGGNSAKTYDATPIRPPTLASSQLGSGSSAPRPSAQRTGSASRLPHTTTPILPPTRPALRSTSMGSSSQTSTGTSPVPPSSQSGSVAKNSKKGDTPKSSPLKYRKPRKF